MANPYNKIVHKLKAVSQYGFHIAICGKSARTNATTKINAEVTCMHCKDRLIYIEPTKILNKENR